MYIPHMVYHSVWNVSPTVAIGDNPLYTSSFNEWAGFDYKKENDYKFLFDRMLLKTNGETKSQMLNILNQIETYTNFTESEKAHNDVLEADIIDEDSELNTKISGRVSDKNKFLELSGRMFH